MPSDPYETIAAAVAVHYRVPYDRLIALRQERPRNYRAPQFVEARQVAMYLIREVTGNSYPEIARFFHVDHTTVIGACKRMEAAFPLRAEPLADQVLFPQLRVGNA